MRKAITNLDYLFQWNAPFPINGTPTITINGSTSSLSQNRAAVSVTAIAADRRTLTLSTSATSLEQDQERATAILAEPLPREIDLSSASSLEFALWSTTLTSSVTGTSASYPYIVNYTADLGAETILRSEKGLLKVTPRIFTTGLDHDQLTSTFAQLADMIPRRQSDLEPQIKASLEEVILIVRDHVIPSNCTEDEVWNPEQFLQAHSYYAAARVYELNNQFDQAGDLRQRGEDLLLLGLRSVALDLDGDGVLDEGEENLRESGGRATDVRGSNPITKSAYDKTFIPSRAMRH
jgi:hypothetical protein